jgi:hypothetical protein
MKNSFIFAVLTASFLFCGCSLATGDRIDFGHSFPTSKYRGRTYYVTNHEDSQQVKRLKAEIVSGDLVERAIAENKLESILLNYHSGPRGWF